MTIKEAFEALSSACANGMKNPFFVMRRLKDSFADVADKVDAGGSVVEVEAELTEGTEIGSITVDGDETILYAPEASGGINYSTSEQDTGLTWIDGKKIYQRTISGLSLMGSGYKTVGTYTGWSKVVGWAFGFNSVSVDYNFICPLAVMYVPATGELKVSLNHPNATTMSVTAVTVQYTK